jgi:hypothetical protein
LAEVRHVFSEPELDGNDYQITTVICGGENEWEAMSLKKQWPRIFCDVRAHHMI